MRCQKYTNKKGSDAVAGGCTMRGKMRLLVSDGIKRRPAGKLKNRAQGACSEWFKDLDKSLPLRLYRSAKQHKLGSSKLTSVHCERQ